MDAHFREYVAAVSGMQETYGEPDDNSPTEFHGAADTQAGRATAISEHWELRRSLQPARAGVLAPAPVSVPKRGGSCGSRERGSAVA